VSRVSIIIPVREDRVALGVCLDSIEVAMQAAPDLDVEVIVVDNGSSDGSPELARSRGARVLEEPGKRVAALRNRGASISTGEFLAFIDADHAISPEWLSAVEEAFRSQAIAAVGYPYTAPRDGTWVQRCYNGLREHRPGRHDVKWLGSGNLLIRRGVFEELGGFDEGLETCEDVELCFSLGARGHRIVSDSRLQSVHFGDPATLSGLFHAELWRGRDNLQVSLRHFSSWRDIPSIAMPITLLVALVVMLITMSLGAWAITIVAAVALLIPPIARTVIIAKRIGEAGIDVAIRTFFVAFTYELARAAALVMRKGHRRASNRAPITKLRLQ
jgi:GT2 family glycosyltransferase